MAYKGEVYDVSESPLFEYGMHFEHYAGEDLTDFMAEAPHGEEVLRDIPAVGRLAE